MSEKRLKEKINKFKDYLIILKKDNYKLKKQNDQLKKAIQTINRQYELGLNFESGTIFARKLYDYHNLKHHVQIATLFPTRHLEIYEWSKKIIREWSLLDVKKTIREFAGYYKLGIQKTWCKFYLDILYEYKLLYEWAMNLPNNQVLTFMTNNHHIISIPKLQCFWETGKDGIERIINIG